MRNEGKLKEYLSQFHNFVIQKAVEVHLQMTNAIVLATYPKQREIWCVFVYHPEIEEFESRLEMWTQFWEDICERRKAFYSDFKKPGFGYITMYPLFISEERLEKLLKESNKQKVQFT